MLLITLSIIVQLLTKVHLIPSTSSPIRLLQITHPNRMRKATTKEAANSCRGSQELHFLGGGWVHPTVEEEKSIFVSFNVIRHIVFSVIHAVLVLIKLGQLARNKHIGAQMMRSELIRIIQGMGCCFAVG